MYVHQVVVCVACVMCCVVVIILSLGVAYRRRPSVLTLVATVPSQGHLMTINSFRMLRDYLADTKMLSVVIFCALLHSSEKAVDKRDVAKCTVDHDWTSPWPQLPQFIQRANSKSVLRITCCLLDAVLDAVRWLFVCVCERESECSCFWGCLWLSRYFCLYKKMWLDKKTTRDVCKKKVHTCEFVIRDPQEVRPLSVEWISLLSNWTHS
jgi:hypothetical protein